MSQLDRLERMGLMVRRRDPRNRRARIPVASACDSVEAAALNSFTQDQVQTFRRMLF
jgi:hypothetical protein